MEHLNRLFNELSLLNLRKHYVRYSNTFMKAGTMGFMRVSFQSIRNYCARRSPLYSFKSHVNCFITFSAFRHSHALNSQIFVLFQFFVAHPVSYSSSTVLFGVLSPSDVINSRLVLLLMFGPVYLFWKEIATVTISWGSQNDFDMISYFLWEIIRVENPS